jgi:hypothetical protein
MPFLALPLELKQKIIRYCIEPRKIDVIFTMRPSLHDRTPLQPAYVLGRTFIRTHISWEYECFSTWEDPNIQNLTLVNKELFKLVEEPKPVWLRVNGRAPIRFHPAQDTIYMDIKSLFCLSHFANEAQYNPALSWSGFNRIKSFATPLKGPRYQGFRMMRAPRRILAGLVEVKDRQIGFKDYTIPRKFFWVWQINEDVCRQLRRLRLLSTRPSERQRTVIREERERLLGLIREFFALP